VLEIQQQFINRGLDFGTVKVHEGGVQTFNLLNRGKYDVSFGFSFKRKATQDLFTIEPATGVLKPASPQAVTIKFKSRGEVSLVDNADIRCNLAEILTNEVLYELPVKVRVRAVFSKYKVLPQKGINFGALMYGTSKTRTFEIQNHGVFDFAYKIVALKTAPPPPTGAAQADTQAKAPAGKDAPKKGAAAPAGGAGSVPTLTTTAFTIYPSEGTVGVNGSRTVTVEFKAEGAVTTAEIVGIVVADRDESGDGPDGLPYELNGESCVPGINTGEWEDVFEEQSVIKRIDDVRGNVFCVDEKTFEFGPIVVATQAEVRFKVRGGGWGGCSDAADFEYNEDPLQRRVRDQAQKRSTRRRQGSSRPPPV
jgi:hydrocephalus-inducing protein